MMSWIISFVLLWLPAAPPQEPDVCAPFCLNYLHWAIGICEDRYDDAIDACGWRHFCQPDHDDYDQERCTECAANAEEALSECTGDAIEGYEICLFMCGECYPKL